MRRFLTCASLLASTVVLLGCDQNVAYQPPPPVEVLVARPISRDITRYLELTGQTKPVRRVDLVARVQGTLTDIRREDGAAVKQGDVLFVIEPDNYKLNLDLALAAEAQQRALLVQADSDLARQKQLATKQAASEAALENALSKRDSTIAALEQMTAQVSQAKLNLSYTEVKAPFDGTISARLFNEGALVGVRGPTKLASIVQENPVHVDFSVDEQTVLRIREAMRQRNLTLADVGPIAVEIGLGTEAGYPHTGTLDYVAPELDAASGTLPVRAVVPNPNRLLSPGMFVRVRLPVQRNLPSLLIPDRALGASQAGRYLLVVNDRDIVEQRPVEVGDLTEGGLRVIVSGVSATDRVVVGRLQGAIPDATVHPVDVDVETVKH